MNNNFNDKVALVTGASSGMGLATALAFAEAGASVTLADVKEEAVQKAAEKLVSEGHRAIAIPCDVSNDAQVEAMVERTVAQFGRLDAAFNNAGFMAKNSPTADSTLEEFDRVTRVNLQGVWSCMKHELRHMDRQGSGAIVNCSSIGGVRGRPGYSVLYRVQARCHRSNAGCSPRIRRQRHPGERSLPRNDRHGVCPHSAQGRGRIRGLFKSLAPLAGSASPRRSRRWCFGCAAREQASSLGTHWWSTVGKRYPLGQLWRQIQRDLEER